MVVGVVEVVEVVVDVYINMYVSVNSLNLLFVSHYALCCG